MTEAVLDQFQKLFGKGFLIAAFVPSILFVCFLKFLRAGWWEMQMALARLWSDGWKISLNVLAYLVIIYLLAYVIYGMRGLLHNLFQGQWSITLSTTQQYNEAIILPDWALTDLPIRRHTKRFVKWLEFVLNLPFRAGQRWEVNSFRKLKEISDLRVSVLDIPRWILKENFDRTFNAIRLDHDQAFALIETVDAKHRDFMQRFREEEDWNESEYWDIVATAQLLRANRKRLKHAQPAIDLLINDIKETYYEKDSEALRQAVEHLSESADRDWRSVYSRLKATFPEEERWMRPTRLGNIAMVQEIGPLKRYGINLSAIWPRLMHVLPAEARQRLGDANIYVDFTVIMSLLAFISGGTAIYSAFYGPPGRSSITRVLLIIACFAVFWAFYQLAIQATRGFGVELQSAVDAYRLKLLDLVGLERPASAEEEQKIWRALRYFISQGDLPKEGVRIKTVTKAEEKEKSGGTRVWYLD
jgi:hypothetical protein